MSYRAYFQCISPECGQTYPLDEVVYQCGTCQNLLEVKHDMEALKSRSAVNCCPSPSCKSSPIRCCSMRRDAS